MSGEKPSVGSHDSFVKMIVQHALTILTTVSVMYVGLDSNDAAQASNRTSADVAIYEATLRRVAELEDDKRNLESQVFQSNLKVIELMTKSGGEKDGFQILQDYIDSQNFSAWIKIKDEQGRFRMLMINNHYAAEYCISKLQYHGSTDYDIWPEDVAREFEKNDQMVLESKGSFVFSERVPRKNCRTGMVAKINLHIFKYTVTLPSGQLGVGGQSYPLPDSYKMRDKEDDSK